MKLSPDVLVVGSEGYVGSNCTLDNFVGIDKKSGGDFLNVIPDRQYATIVFLAIAEVSITSSIEDYLYNESLYDALDAWLVAFPRTHVIFASSAAVYGESTRPVKESDYLAPLSLYGRSKLAGEFRVREYQRHTVLRFGNVYGKLKGQAGHGVTEAFQSGQRVIYGNGEQIRDFVEIGLIWRVIEAAINYPVIWRGVTNISTGEGVSINEWFEKWGMGVPSYALGRPLEIFNSVLDNTKMFRRLAECQ